MSLSPDQSDLSPGAASPSNPVNALLRLTTLNNEWLVLRHASAASNSEGVNQGDRKVGIEGYHTTAEGLSDLEEAIRDSVAVGLLPKDPVIISSDFRRTAESARKVAQQCPAAVLLYDSRLREREFRQFEGSKVEGSAAIRLIDRTDPYYEGERVEGAASLVSRVSSLVSEVDALFSGKTFLLVTHGDVIKAAEVAFAFLPPQTLADIAVRPPGTFLRLTLGHHPSFKPDVPPSFAPPREEGAPGSQLNVSMRDEPHVESPILCGIRELRPLQSPAIVAFGVGHAYIEKLQPALLRLWKGDLIAVDTKLQSLRGLSGLTARVWEDASGQISRELSKSEQAHAIALVGTQAKLPVIKRLVEAGFRKLIVEKPIAVNAEEVGQLSALHENEVDLRIYAIEHYLTKALPLLYLTGDLKVEDARNCWIKGVDGNPPAEELRGALFDLIGQPQRIYSRIVEGGKFGVPDICARRYLLDDPVNGGMLLDLGTHAFSPLFAAGFLDHLSIYRANRFRLNGEMSAIEPASRGDVECYAEVALTSVIGGREVPISACLGKVPGPENWDDWQLRIEGERGRAVFHLRTGGTLKVFGDGREEPLCELKLAGQPYDLAIQEALWLFEGRLGRFEGNVPNALCAVDLIEAIKSHARREES